MVKWFCCSALCLNNHRSRNLDGSKINFYRLPRSVEIQSHYTRILRTSGINWSQGHICRGHWTNGTRTGSEDLPDKCVADGQLEKLLQKYEAAKRLVECSKTKDAVVRKRHRSALKEAKRKYELALSASATSTVARKEPTQRIEQPSGSQSKRSPSKAHYKKKLLVASEELTGLDSEMDVMKAELEKLKTELAVERSSVKVLEEEKLRLSAENTRLKNVTALLQKTKFSYTNLLLKPNRFSYLCGLCVEQFDLLFSCIEPYTHLIPYPDCKGNGIRLTDKKTELFAVLVICRHALHMGVMALILDVSDTSVERIFIGWILFMSAILSEVNLKPAAGFLISKMPPCFVKTGHGLTDLVIDATEFKFQHASNYELSSLMFSNYKNTVTGKALIGIAPHGMGILFSDIYPGSISDSEITEKADALSFVAEEHEVMSDRGFAIQDLCLSKGVSLNRPKQRENDQFSQTDVAQNFDIAATRIHVERFIGRVRGWNILNVVWPLNRIDILSSTWQSLCHVVNFTMPPIGPRIKP